MSCGVDTKTMLEKLGGARAQLTQAKLHHVDREGVGFVRDHTLEYESMALSARKQTQRGVGGGLEQGSLGHFGAAQQGAGVLFVNQDNSLNGALDPSSKQESGIYMKMQAYQSGSSLRDITQAQTDQQFAERKRLMLDALNRERDQDKEEDIAYQNSLRLV